MGIGLLVCGLDRIVVVLVTTCRGNIVQPFENLVIEARTSEKLMKYSASTATLLLSLISFGLIFGQDGPESVVRGTKQFRRSILAPGLAGPWEVTWGPDAKLWVTERTGKRITRIDPADGRQSVAITIDEVSAPGGQDGLLGMALHPELLKGAGNDYVYIFYTYVDESAGAHPAITDPASPYRYLYGKIVRLTYNAAKRNAVRSHQRHHASAGRQRPSGRTPRIWSRPEALPYNRRPRKQSVQQCLLRRRVPTPADPARDEKRGLHRLRR
jgi:hypothetical protein